MTAVPPHARILVDCRWLDKGGAGRATELLLKGLARVRPPGRWTLLGPAAVADFLWPGAEHILSHASPLAWMGQRGTRLPVADVTLFLHQIRPLRRRRAITVIHDTIPIRYGGSPLSRWAKKRFLKWSARLSTHVVTDSEYSRDRITEDLDFPRNRISVIPFPIDPDFVERVERHRRQHEQAERVLYVGRFGSHKNLHTLVHAFLRTGFHRTGGSLWLVGGSPDEVGEMKTWLPNDVNVEIRGGITQDELEILYATSRLVVLPSFEEGFGLPVWEARTCGIPVAISTGGSLPEVAGSDAEVFDPHSEDGIVAAIDRAIDHRRRVAPPTEPTLESAARTWIDLVGRVLAAN